MTNQHCICRVAIRAAPLLCAKFGGKTGMMIMSKLVVSSPMPPYCYSGLKWAVGIVTVMGVAVPATSSNVCSTVIVPPFIHSETVGGVFNCFFGHSLVSVNLQ